MKTEVSWKQHCIRMLQIRLDRVRASLFDEAVGIIADISLFVLQKLSNFLANTLINLNCISTLPLGQIRRMGLFYRRV